MHGQHNQADIVPMLVITFSWTNIAHGRRRAIIWTNGGNCYSNLATNFSKILSKIYVFSLKKMYLKMSSAKWWQFCLSLYVLSPLYRKLLQFPNEKNNAVML